MKTERLLVSRQDPSTRRYSRVGVLRREGDDYVFTYEPGVERAIPGLRLGDVHRSEELFPVFAQRIMHPLRPDRASSLALLGLEHSASPFEVLAVSGGLRTGDTFEVTPLPEPGEVELPFLVHGIRYMEDDDRLAIDGLSPGDRLALRQETDNEFNDRALIVSRSDARLGYVPDPLVEYFHQVMKHEHSVTVERVNPPEVGFHLRLLAVLRGHLEVIPD